MITCDTTSLLINNVLQDDNLEVKIRSICGDGNSEWNSIILNQKKYWPDFVEEEPEGFALSGDSVVVSSAEGLAWWIRQCENYDFQNGQNSKTIVINEDIDLGSHLWKPIRYYGNIKGNGHSVNNLRTEYFKGSSGLFSFLEGDTITDLHLKNAVVCGHQVGTLAGNVHNAVVINCSSTDYIIRSLETVGGLLGGADYSHIINCFSIGENYGQNGNGGIVGSTSYSEFYNCYSRQNNGSWGWLSINSDLYGPGLIAGHDNNGVYNNCFADIENTNRRWDPSFDSIATLYYFFGYVVYEGIQIESAINVATFRVEGDTIGRIIQDTAVNYSRSENVDLLTALNDKVVEDNASDLRMWVWDSVLHSPVFGDYYEPSCPNVSDITAKVIEKNNGFAVALSWVENGGAEEWQIKYNIESSLENSSIIVCTHAIADTLEGLSLGNTYYFYVRPICTGEDTVGWGQPVKLYVDKPYWVEVITECPDGYMKDDEGNVTVFSAEALAWFCRMDMGQCFEGKTLYVGNDIDMGAYRWRPLGCFWGTIEGNNHTLSNLICRESTSDEDSRFIGFVGMGNRTTVRNLIIKDGLFAGREFVGSLFGSAMCSVFDNCHIVNTQVTGNSSVAGLGGEILSSGLGECIVNNCSASGTIYANQGVGGLIAGCSNEGRITNCFANCNLYSFGHSPLSIRGGLVGGNSGVFTNCYSIGIMEFDSINYYNVTGSSIGNISINGEMHYVYAQSHDGIPFEGRDYALLVYPYVLSDTATFTNSGILNSEITIGDTSFRGLLSVLNAWVDTYDTLGIYRHWAADSANVNNGFPVFMNIPCTPFIHTITTVRACESYTWNDSTYTQSTIINDTLQTADGCDSISSIVIKIGEHPTSSYEQHRICPGDSYTFNGRILTETGYYEDTIISGSYTGCDSIAQLWLEVSYPSSYEQHRICPGDSYTFNGRILTETGYYYDTIVGGSYLGCDSIVQLWLEVQSPTSWNDARICEGESYSWRGKTLTETNGYYDTIPNGATNGCDSIVYLWLEVRSDYSYSEAKICQGDSYLFRDRILTQSGFYQDTLAGASAAGCDSIVQLNLIVNPSYNLHDTIVVPEGALPYLYSYSDWTDDVDGFSVTMNNDIRTINTRINPSGTIFDNGGANGNYSDDFNGMVILSANQGETIKLTGQYDLEGNCDYLVVYDGYGESGNNLIYTSGNGSVDLQSSTGFLTIRFYSDGSVNYEGFALTWNTQSHRDTLLSAAGDYTIEAHTENGCYSIVNLHLDVRSPYVGTDSITICSNNLPYSYADTLISDSGTYTFHYLDRYGIDSTRILILSVISALDSVETVTVCESYTWNGATYTTTGDYTYSHTDANGCTQVDTLHLTINPKYFFPETHSICQGETYNWRNKALSTAGVYYDSLQTIAGCDSVYKLTLTVNPTYFFQETYSICQGEIYNWRNKSLSAAGVYYDSLKTAIGCDSIYKLTLLVNSTYLIQQTVKWPSSKGNYIWRGKTIASAGIYYDSLKTISYCDSVYKLTIQFADDYLFTEYVSICQGEQYSWRGNDYREAGIYYDSLRTVDGILDSVYELTLKVNPTYFFPETHSICQSETYNWRNRSLTNAGVFYDSLKTVAGCDSVYELTLTVNPTYLFQETYSICQGETYNWRSKSLSTAGVYYDSLKTTVGCDSVYELTLTVNPTYLIQETYSICQGETYNWRSKSLSTAGVYYDSLKTTVDCDSVYELTLTVNPTYFFPEAYSICQGETYNWRNKALSTAGVYYDSLKTTIGCDSVYELTLTVNPTYFFPETHSICQGETYNWRNKALSVARVYYDSLKTTVGCDSVYELTLTVNPTYLFPETYSICQGETYNWRNKALSVAGVYYDSLQTTVGCDSVYELTLTINPTYLFPETYSICQGETYTWRNKVLSVAGVYYDSLQTTVGCDSVYELTLTVNPTYLFPETYSICQGETYNWRNKALSTAGVYYDSLKTVAGCDSVYELTLTVNPTYFFPETYSICQGETYNWHNKSLTNAGVYYDSLKTTVGCDSVYELTLTINPTYEMMDSAQLTDEGSGYLWHDKWYYEPGVYYDSLKTVDDCDSVIILNLSDYVPSGVDEVSMAIVITLAPNPINGGEISYVYADWTDKERDGMMVEIISTSGQIIKRMKPETFPISIDDIPITGTYLVRIVTGTGNVYIKKLIVM